MARYDRAAAIAYARKFWTKVSSDGFIACKDMPKTRFYAQVPLDTVFQRNVNGMREAAIVPGHDTIGWHNLEDCTHFMSCVMGSPPGGEKSGGLRIASQGLGTPGKVPYGMISAPRLSAHLKETFARQLKGDSPRQLPKGMEAGDLIVYKKSPQGDAAHFGFYLGDGKIVCHTMCRLDHAWDDIEGLKHYEFLHVIA